MDNTDKDIQLIGTNTESRQIRTRNFVKPFSTISFILLLLWIAYCVFNADKWKTGTTWIIVIILFSILIALLLTLASLSYAITITIDSLNIRLTLSSENLFGCCKNTTSYSFEQIALVRVLRRNDKFKLIFDLIKDKLEICVAEGNDYRDWHSNGEVLLDNTAEMINKYILILQGNKGINLDVA